MPIVYRDSEVLNMFSRILTIKKPDDFLWADILETFSAENLPSQEYNWGKNWGIPSLRSFIVTFNFFDNLFSDWSTLFRSFLQNTLLW